GFEKSGIVELAVAHRLSERPAGDVLVRDVHVLGVARERIRTQAALVPELGCGRRLTFGARAAGALAGDDLERHLPPALPVSAQPHGPRAARAERPDRAVPSEHERSGREGCCGLRHAVLDLLAAAGQIPFRSGRWARVLRPPPEA